MKRSNTIVHTHAAKLGFDDNVSDDSEEDQDSGVPTRTGSKVSGTGSKVPLSGSGSQTLGDEEMERRSSKNTSSVKSRLLVANNAAKVVSQWRTRSLSCTAALSQEERTMLKQSSDHPDQDGASTMGPILSVPGDSILRRASMPPPEKSFSIPAASNHDMSHAQAHADDAMPKGKKGIRFDVGDGRPARYNSKRSSPGGDVIGVKPPPPQLGKSGIGENLCAIRGHRDSVEISTVRKVVVEAAVMRHKTIAQSPKQPAPPGLPTGTPIQQHKHQPAASADAAPRAYVKSWVIRALRNVKLFSDCSTDFLRALGAGAEQLQLVAGELKNVVTVRAPGTPSRLAAVVVHRGSGRIEIDQKAVLEVGPGSSFGLATLMASALVRSGRGTAEGDREDFVLRAGGTPDGIQCLVLYANVFRKALLECPQGQGHLRDAMPMVSRHVKMGTATRLMAVMLCSESARTAIVQSTTRHFHMAGETFFEQGSRSPEGLVLVRSGTLAVEINGVEVRRVGEGQVIGQAIMLNVCQGWATTVRCVTSCDLYVLHRSLFMTFVRALQGSTNEDQRESKRLLHLLDSRWKEDRVVLAWPLFRGYDQDLLGSLARLIETCVSTPGTMIWESRLGDLELREAAMHFLLYGAADETVSSDRVVHGTKGPPSEWLRTRTLAPGACISVREFLGLRECHPTTVTARTICLVAVLYRSTFLCVIENYTKEFRSAEVTSVLEEEVDRVEGLMAQNDGERLVSELPFLRGVDRRFVECIVRKAARRYYIAQQRLCRANVETSTMYVLARGDVRMTIAGLEVRKFSRGAAINILAMAAEPFTPSFTVTCEQACDLWALTRDSFAKALEAFPSVKGRLGTLLGTQVRSLRLAMSATVEGQADHGPSNVLPSISYFHGCCPEFIAFLQPHLEVMLCFPDQVILREGEEDSCFFVVFNGTVIIEGTGESSQMTVSCGGSFGVQRLLGMSQHSAVTVQAIETTTLMVMHRCVFLKALELFPSEMAHFDRTTLIQMNASGPIDLSEVTLFKRCSRAFRAQVANLMRTRLVHKGRTIVEEGSEVNGLCVLLGGAAGIVESNSARGVSVNDTRSRGDAMALEEQHLQLREWDAINVRVALGITKRAPATVKAEKTSPVGEVDSMTFLSILKRFPEEIRHLVLTQTGELEADAFPLFKGINQRVFSWFVEKVDWQMHAANRCVVKQGSEGSLLFLLCHGFAVTEDDGIALGPVLGRGDGIGIPNFFGQTTKYTLSLRTTAISHIIVASAGHLAEMLQEHPAERERFEYQQLMVSHDAVEREKWQRAHVMRGKRRRRMEGAFRGHVATLRDARRLPHDTPMPPSSSEQTIETAYEVDAGTHGSSDEDSEGESEDGGFREPIDIGTLSVPKRSSLSRQSITPASSDSFIRRGSGGRDAVAHPPTESGEFPGAKRMTSRLSTIFAKVAVMKRLKKDFLSSVDERLRRSSVETGDVRTTSLTPRGNSLQIVSEADCRTPSLGGSEDSDIDGKSERSDSSWQGAFQVNISRASGAEPQDQSPTSRKSRANSCDASLGTSRKSADSTSAARASLHNDLSPQGDGGTPSQGEREEATPERPINELARSRHHAFLRGKVLRCLHSGFPLGSLDGWSRPLTADDVRNLHAGDVPLSSRSGRPRSSPTSSCLTTDRVLDPLVVPASARGSRVSSGLTSQTPSLTATTPSLGAGLRAGVAEEAPGDEPQSASDAKLAASARSSASPREVFEMQCRCGCKLVGAVVFCKNCGEASPLATEERTLKCRLRSLVGFPAAPHGRQRPSTQGSARSLAVSASRAPSDYLPRRPSKERLGSARGITAPSSLPRVRRGPARSARCRIGSAGLVRGSKDGYAEATTSD